jgi:hypothetical protein
LVKRVAGIDYIADALVFIVRRTKPTHAANRAGNVIIQLVFRIDKWAPLSHWRSPGVIVEAPAGRSVETW